MSELGLPARVVWHLGTDSPLTVKELTGRMGAKYESVQTATQRLYKAGLLIRRRREAEDGWGATPYEYAIRIPEEHE